MSFGAAFFKADALYLLKDTGVWRDQIPLQGYICDIGCGE